MSKVRYPIKLMEECPEEIGKRESCVHYSPVKGRCKRRWAGRTPEKPCECWMMGSKGSI